MTREELLRIIDFVEQSRAAADTVEALAAPAPEWRMALFLMRRHLEDKLVTVTSLAAASGAPYATAMRRIEHLFSHDLIVRKPRTGTGRSFSLHPSPRLVEEFRCYAVRMKQLVGRTIGVSKRGDYDNFYFGASYLAGRIIPPASPRGGDASGQTIRMPMFIDPTSRAVQGAVAEIERTLEARLDISTFGLDALRRDLWRNARATLSDYDIIPLDMPWIAEFAEAGALLPLDEILRAAHFNHGDFHPTGWAAGRYHGVQFGIPIQTTPELLLYRTDLFAEAGLPPPTDTQRVLDAARYFHAPAAGRYGIAWNGRRGTPIAHSFVLVMAAFGRPILALRRTADGFDTSVVAGEEMRPTIDTPEGLLTAEYLRELLSVSCPDVLNMAWDERVRSYSRGDVAIAYEWSIRAGVFEMDPRSPARGHTGYLPPPHGPGQRGHVSPIGGFILGIPANLAPARVPLAWRTIEWLTSPEMMKLFIQHGGTVSPRFSVSADPEIVASCTVIPIVNRMEKSGQIQAWPRPPVPASSDCMAVLGEEVHDLMLGRTSPRAMLRKAQNRIDSIMRGRGYYA
jgi:multiple sugar transport system substrate-binding protein